MFIMSCVEIQKWFRFLFFVEDRYFDFVNTARLDCLVGLAVASANTEREFSGSIPGSGEFFCIVIPSRSVES